MNPKEYIESKIERDPERGCWLWTGALVPNGYGRAKLKGKMDYAHRFSYEVFVGPIPEGKSVLHHCDVRHCVNPEHLYSGTHQDNMDDRSRRKRTAAGDRHWSRTSPEKLARGDSHGARTRPEQWARGDDHWTRKNPEKVLRGDNHPHRKNPANVRRGEGVNKAKLNEAAVVEIRALYAAGKMTQVQLAEKFGVFQSTIGQIVRRKTWTHVK